MAGWLDRWRGYNPTAQLASPCQGLSATCKPAEPISMEHHCEDIGLTETDRFLAMAVHLSGLLTPSVRSALGHI